MTQSAPDLVGTIAGDYRVLSQIGTGSMGHVYEAEHVTTTKRVGLKVLHKHHQEEFAPRFLREGKTLRLLSHPNIVELVDMGMLDNGSLYLATELVAGVPLRELMDQGAIDEKRALAIVRQVLDALDAAHALGVVHRDIKPENIMIAAGDVVKVLDFGVAKLLADTVAGLGEANLTSVGFSVFGSALYIAPESVIGKPIDARLDLYSVGAVLYELVTGRPPYDHDDPTELLKLHAFAPVPTLQQATRGRTFTRELEYLVAHALAKEPDDRFRSAAAMIAAVDAALRSIETIDRPLVWPVAPNRAASRPRAQTPRPRVRLPRKYLVIAGGAMTVIVVVAILMVTGDGSKAAPRATSELATRANQLVAAGSAKEAVELLEHADPKQQDGAALLALGHARFALGRRVDALAAYERALRDQSDLGADKALRANLTTALDTKDDLAATLALELLAALAPPARDAITTYASTGKLADARHRAVMLAERDGFADKIDRVESWSLDLVQTASCDERKAIIEKLVATSDQRVLTALKKIRPAKCIEHDVADAIARLEAAK